MSSLQFRVGFFFNFCLKVFIILFGYFNFGFGLFIFVFTFGLPFCVFGPAGSPVDGIDDE